MGDSIVALAGTETGAKLALALALVSALAHAIFAAINKGGLDPYLNRGVINVAYSIMAAPFALFVFPLPEPHLIPILLLSYILHIIYEWFVAAAFTKGEFTLVYPIARGTSPLITAALSLIIFSESLESSQWFGMFLLSGAIISFAGINLAQKGRTSEIQKLLLPSILLAIGAGVMIALYTTVDAYGIRATADPFTLIAWFFFMGGFGFPMIAFWRWKQLELKPAIMPLVSRAIIGALVAFFSFATLMLATRVGKVSEAAALRETSIVFATIIGILFFKEKVGPAKLFAIGLIVLGAILIEFH